ncbi:MAG: hypothetical protein ACXAC7_19070 [Candidatus Hodarchaeales archaeon]|jgi:hypothetical protein
MVQNKLSLPMMNNLRSNQLSKQFFLAKKASTFFEIVKTQLGLHSTDYWTPYFSVFARLGDFDAKEMFQALNTGNKLVRINAFKRTVFVIHVDNNEIIHKAHVHY